MKLTDYYNAISRKVDTDSTKINVAETKRVMAVAFDVLVGMSAADAADTIAKGLATAEKRSKKKKK